MMWSGIRVGSSAISGIAIARRRSASAPCSISTCLNHMQEVWITEKYRVPFRTGFEQPVSNGQASQANNHHTGKEYLYAQ